MFFAAAFLNFPSIANGILGVTEAFEAGMRPLPLPCIANW